MKFPFPTPSRETAGHRLTPAELQKGDKIAHWRNAWPRPLEVSTVAETRSVIDRRLTGHTLVLRHPSGRSERMFISADTPPAFYLIGETNA